MKYNQHFPKVCLNSVDVFQKLVQSVEEIWSWILLLYFLKPFSAKSLHHLSSWEWKDLFPVLIGLFWFDLEVTLSLNESFSQNQTFFSSFQNWENLNARNEDWIFLKNPSAHWFSHSIQLLWAIKVLIYMSSLEKLCLL